MNDVRLFPSSALFGGDVRGPEMTERCRTPFLSSSLSKGRNSVEMKLKYTIPFEQECSMSLFNTFEKLPSLQEKMLQIKHLHGKL